MLQRTREFGVRTALGASPGEVALLVARQASWLVVIGLAIGIVIARLGTRFLASQLFGVRPNAPGLYIVVAMILALIAGAAVIVPRFAPRRSTRSSLARGLATAQTMAPLQPRVGFTGP